MSLRDTLASAIPGVSLASSLLGGKAALDSLKFQKKMAKEQAAHASLDREKAEWEQANALAKATGDLNIGRAAHQIQEEGLGEFETRRRDQAGQAGRIAQLLQGSSVTPHATARTAQFSSAGNIPEMYDSPDNVGTPMQRALNDYQAQNLAELNMQASNLGQLAGMEDLMLQDQRRMDEAQRTMPAEEFAGRALSRDQEGQKQRLTRESAELDFAHRLQNKNLQDYYKDFLKPQYIPHPQSGATAAMLGGISEGMERFLGATDKTQRPVYQPLPQSQWGNPGARDTRSVYGFQRSPGVTTAGGMYTPGSYSQPSSLATPGGGTWT